MSGVFGILVGMRRLSGILIVLVCNILSKLISFSPTSNKNLVNVMNVMMKMMKQMQTFILDCVMGQLYKYYQ